ncbi:FMN-linked alkanal monooxygenase [Lentzea sp. NBRC 105346]|uniref:LLM class flavin-dependent oxidoreductase n=1 Tax=Lentzea sp. NBRC 105346 TaxID=3032205 RepID=UPI00249FBD01|nr:LLM class flavin-dependent oxidoreductase [Lentzea sp. NBRC 105346]GLZ31167.1 FMN-linked alkanal monooxygenase [Lentzea sp. NBRC 105346]
MSRLREIPLSVLDLAPITSGSDATTALRNTRELAQLAERLGFTRYWVAEHHNMPGIASSAPAVLIEHIASATSTIRVGSGGVMLPNHPSLVVAEQFGMLEALHPGRIDLGIGRAPGTDQRTARALRRSEAGLSAEDFPQQLTELMQYFAGTADIAAVPAAGNRPPLWLLGSSGYSAQAAGMLGLPFAFAHHFSAQNTLPALELYRRHFRPSEVLSESYAMVCASVIVADTDEHARWIAGPGALSFVRLRQGRPGPLSSPTEAAEYPYTDIDRLVIEDRMATQIIGSPETVSEGISQLLDNTQADELMVTTIVHGHEDRLRSFELLSELAERTPQLGRSAVHT